MSLAEPLKHLIKHKAKCLLPSNSWESHRLDHCHFPKNRAIKCTSKCDYRQIKAQLKLNIKNFRAVT